MSSSIQLIALFYLCLALVAAQQPAICRSPPAWDAHVHRIDPEGKNGFYVRGHFYYDELERRDAMVEEIDSSQPRAFFWTINLHKLGGGTQYQINLSTGQCKKQKITWGWHPIGVQPGSQFLYQGYIGSSMVPGGNTLINAWGFGYPDGISETQVTEYACLPVGFSFLSNSTQPNAPQYVRQAWYDLAPGINDPSKFVPPSNC